MTAIVHRTPGLIDIRSFTTMGMSAKIGTNPIGMFGTGLKYAIAVLVRAGARPVVWIGRDRYEFFCEPTNFRGKDFQLIRMRVKKWGGLRHVVHDLPFTTEYGRNWKMWMAFRELEANTRDEDGETYHDTAPVEMVAPREGETTIVIDHQDYVQAWEDRRNIFLTEGLKDRMGSEGMQVMEGKTHHAYYRGMRAMDLPKQALYTWNVLANVELTEDRTLKYPHQLREAIAAHLLKSDDEELIKTVLRAGENDFEHELEFPQYITPGATFKKVMRDKTPGLSARAWGYYSRYDDSPTITSRAMLDKHPRPWRVEGQAVVDLGGKTVFDAPYRYEGRWDLLAGELIGRLGFGEDLDEEEVVEVDVVEPVEEATAQPTDDEEIPF